MRSQLRRATRAFGRGARQMRRNRFRRHGAHMLGDRCSGRLGRHRESTVPRGRPGRHPTCPAPAQVHRVRPHGPAAHLQRQHRAVGGTGLLFCTGVRGFRKGPQQRTEQVCKELRPSLPAQIYHDYDHDDHDDHHNDYNHHHDAQAEFVPVPGHHYQTVYQPEPRSLARAHCNPDFFSN